MTDIETDVRTIIADITRQDVSLLEGNDDLVERLGIDSLQGLQILAAVEKRCGVRLADEELITLRTINRIANAVDRARRSVRLKPDPTAESAKPDSVTVVGSGFSRTGQARTS